MRVGRHRRLVAVLVGVSLVTAACSSGRSVLDAGRDEPDPTTPSSNDAEDTDGATGGEGDDSSDVEGSTPATTRVATTTTTPLAALPPCPTEALSEADGPVEVVFWHAMTTDIEPVLVELTDQYNSTQDRVRVRLENQIGYETAIERYIAASSGSRPTLIQLPEYTLTEFADSGTFVPISACLESSGYDTTAILPKVLGSYQLEGVVWGMPFNVSNPVLFYNRRMFVDAGLDPDDPPVSLDDLRSASQALVDSGAASSGLVLESGPDSGGGWFLEQWFGRAGELYADNGNGRLARSTQVLYDNELGVELLTFLQQMIVDGIAVDVGDNASGTDSLLKLADQTDPAAMVVFSSAAIGTVLTALGGGLVPDLTPADVGVGPMPGPGENPSAQVGGGSLWIPAGKSDAETAAAWDFVSFLSSAESQSTWAAHTGYVPIRSDALDIEPLISTYEADPRFAVAYDQLLAGAVDDPATYSPALGPLRQVRAETARAVATVFDGGDPATALASAAEASDALIRSYDERN